MLFMGREVESVYEGKRNRCCCGCCGVHSENPERIAKVLRLLTKHASKLEDHSSFVAVELKTRVHIAYFVPQEVQS